MAAAVALPLTACEREQPPPREAAPISTSERALVVASDFQAGARTAYPVVRNPYANDPEARAQGERVYVWFNCAGCHGTLGGGGMGPPLRDEEWIYGGDPASIFQSIAQGRPNGMPAFGGKLPDDQIWKLVLHVRDLGGPSSPQRQGRGSGDAPTQTGSGER